MIIQQRNQETSVVRSLEPTQFKELRNKSKIRNKMESFSSVSLFAIIPMVVFFSCCVIPCVVGAICGKCKIGVGRNNGNAIATNGGARHYNHRGRNHGLHSSHVFTIDTGNCGSYGSGFGGGDFGGGTSGGGCGVDSGGCGGTSGGCDI